jgi:hypothetical protein
MALQQNQAGSRYRVGFQLVVQAEQLTREKLDELQVVDGNEFATK